MKLSQQLIHRALIRLAGIRLLFGWPRRFHLVAYPFVLTIKRSKGEMNFRLPPGNRGISGEQDVAYSLH
jgi:hypothetical protein